MDKDHEKTERFVLLLKSADLLLNELALTAAECLPEEHQRKIRRSIAEFWNSGHDVREFIYGEAPAAIRIQMDNLYPRQKDQR